MKHISKTILAALAIGLLSCGLFSQQAQAAPITGEIKMVGDVVLNSTHLDLATTVMHWISVQNHLDKSTVLPGADGSFSGIAGGTEANMAHPWVFNPSTPTAALWSVGGFSFDLTQVTSLTQDSHFLNVLAVGTLHGPAGFDDTQGMFSFTVDNANGKTHVSFGFAADTVATPDGGTTVMLLVAALGALGMVRRYLKS
jgi:hypothetical protein